MLTVRPEDAATHRASDLRGLPFGRFDPAGDRTFELALRILCDRAQTGFSLGYVEQLYTFGDKGRDAPSGRPRGDRGGARRADDFGELSGAHAAGQGSHRRRRGLASLDAIFPLGRLAQGPSGHDRGADRPSPDCRWAGSQRRPPRPRAPAVRPAGCGGAADQPWNEERVLDRYELLYEAGLAREADRDHDRAEGARPPEPSPFDPTYGRPLVSDHRRILATALGRLRGKLKYRPVVFELMPEAFTLLDLQRAVEAISGVRLHKQNFRRMIERTGLVEGLGRQQTETGGRPAELFRYRREALATSGASPGFRLPAASEG